MNHALILQNALSAHRLLFQELDMLSEELLRVGAELENCIKRGNKILLMGNGGSASDSQHIAAEIVGRYKKERKGLPAIALTTDTSILTAVGNDYGFDFIFSRQIEALCQPKDVVIGISTSGNSVNVIRAIEQASLMGAITVGMTGMGGGKLAKLCQYCLCSPSNDTARIQESHIFIGHTLCEILESDSA